MALAETQIIADTKALFEEEGVNLNVLASHQNPNIPRSREVSFNFSFEIILSLFSHRNFFGDVGSDCKESPLVHEKERRYLSLFSFWEFRFLIQSFDCWVLLTLFSPRSFSVFLFDFISPSRASRSCSIQFSLYR
jgi:hypothetical protein